jgi:hypothetical protein
MWLKVRSGGLLRNLDRTARSEEERVLAVFDYLDSKAHGPEYRGCPFIHSSLRDAEHAGAVYALVRSYKRSLREHVFNLLDDGRDNRGELAGQITVLLDGAVAEAYLRGVEHPAGAAKRAATTLLRCRDRPSDVAR